MRKHLFLAVLLLTAPALAQSQPQPCDSLDVVAGIVTADGNLVRGLSAKYIAAETSKGAPIEIASVSSDTGARRIVFVVDTTRRLTASAQMAEGQMMKRILQGARPNDSFALVTAHGIFRKLPFGQDKAALLKVVDELGTEKYKSEAPGILDALKQAMDWFGEPRLGDSLLVFAERLDDEDSSSTAFEKGHAFDRGAIYESLSKTKFRDLLRLAEDRRIRVFGFSLGAVLPTDFLPSLSSGYSLIGEDVNSGAGTSLYTTVSWKISFDMLLKQENLIGLTKATGGYMILRDMRDPFREFKLTDQQLQQLQKLAWQMYGAIAEVYVVRVKAPPMPHRDYWRLDLKPAVQQKVDASVLYSRELGPCTLAAASQ